MDDVKQLGEALVELGLGMRLGTEDDQYYRAFWLNWLGAARSGSREAVVRRFARSRAALAPGACQPIGQDVRLTPTDCVMADCYASSAQAFDDIHFVTTTHPAGPVASTVLGISRLVDVTLGQAVEALAVGMEVECRLALALFSSSSGSAPGWYTTGIAGGVGAAAAAGRLLKFDEVQMASAMGWAATAACGVRGTHGSAAGTFVPALAARAGFEATLLARDGVHCGIEALSGSNGLVRQIAPSPDAACALENLGSRLISKETSCKPYPFGFVSFAAVDTALELGGIGNNDTVDVYVSPRAAQLGGNPSPATSDEAIVSIPYLVARTLADATSVMRPVPGTFAIGEDEEQILTRVSLHIDQTLADSAARIEVNGGERSARCLAARGSASRPMTVPEVIDKFRSVWSGPNADDLVDYLMGGESSSPFPAEWH